MLIKHTGNAIVIPATTIGKKNLKSLMMIMRASGMYPTNEELRVMKDIVIARVNILMFLSKILGFMFR